MAKFDGNPELKNIFESDNLDNFINFTKTNGISDYFFDPENKTNIISKIIFLNTGKIAKYIIYNNPPDLLDLINLLKLKKLDLFLIGIINNKNKNLDKIFKILFQKNYWSLAEYLFQLNYRVTNFNYINIPINILNIWIQKKYINPDPINIILNPDINIFNISQLKLKINQNINLLKIYKIKPVNIIKYLESLGFIPNINYLDSVCTSHNFPVIIYLLKKYNFKLSSQNLNKILYNNKTKIAPSYYPNDVFYYYPQIIQKFEKTKKKIKNPNYQDYIIYILNHHFKPTNKNKKILNLSTNLFLILKNFKILKLFQNKFGIIPKLKKIFNKLYIYYLINTDDLVSLKKLIKYKFLDKFELSNQKDILEYSIFKNSHQITGYLNLELKMVCSKNITKYLKPWLLETNFIDIIKTLINIQFPLQIIKSDLIQIISENGDLDTLKYIYNLNYLKKSDFKPKLFEMAIQDNNFKFADFFIQIGAKINKNNLLNRVICDQYISSRPNNNLIIKQIKYIFKIGGTGTNKIIPYLATNNQVKSIKLLINKYGYIPDPNTIYNLSKLISYPELIQDLEYLKNKLNINLSGINPDIILNILDFLKSPDILKYFVEILEFKLDLNHLIRYLGATRNYNLEIIKYFESQNIIPDKFIFIRLLLDSIEPCSDKILFSELANYYYGKYNFDLKLFDLHGLINLGYINQNIFDQFEYMGLNITPYTIFLLSRFFYSAFENQIIYCINKLKKITQETLNNILNNYNKKTIRKLNKINYEIIIYQPTELEIPPNFYLGDLLNN